MFPKGCVGQAVLEFTVAMGFLLIIFSLVVITSIQKTSESAGIKTYIDSRRIGNSVKDNINMITEQGRGYYRFFSIPESIHGGYNYSMYAVGNVLEMTYGDNVWSTNLISGNVTIHCLSYGKSVKNRVINRGWAVEVTCHKPNMMFDEANTIVTVNSTTLQITNDAHVGAQDFIVSLSNTTDWIDYHVGWIEPLGVETVSFDSGAGDFCAYIDYQEEVDESIEADNNMTYGGGCTI
ncbi:MAG: hypothetical protein KKD39_01160 [Candidatus Altiarchaeota archaeon]|nr:hypothetical protein [Candidatus Altiarchaeota archaeon]